jgi:hypothetical protein
MKEVHANVAISVAARTGEFGQELQVRVVTECNDAEPQLGGPASLGLQKPHIGIDSN